MNTQPYFIFNNISSEDFDIIVNKLPSIFKAEKDIEKIEVQGRDGFLAQDNNSYKTTIKTVECTIRNTDNIDEICSWLNGTGEVIFSSEPAKKYKATIINQIEFSKILQRFRSFIVQFDCQPYKYSTFLDDFTLTSPHTICNPGTANSKPVIKIYATGNVTLTINSNVITLKNIVDYVTIDSELMDAYKDTVLKNNDMNGDFPEFLTGDNAIAWTGAVSKIEIKPNWRWL